MVTRSVARSITHSLSRHACTLPLAVFPADVDASTGMCADGRVRITSSPSKGWGAFAVQPLLPDTEVGHYAGEVLSLGDVFERYFGGGGSESPQAVEEAEQHLAWVAERQARGVGVTGAYIFNAGRCPHTFRDVLLDGEDPAHANWTRFINHSARRPNLSVTSEVVPNTNKTRTRGTPVVQFIVSSPIAPGEELLFDYGDGFDLDVLGFVED